MGTKNIREKGRLGEREIIDLLQPVVSELCAVHDVECVNLKRNTLQSHGGGFDVHGLDWLALEIKRQEQADINSWWKQCVRQAAPHQEPVLIYRASRQPWRVRMNGFLYCNGMRGHTSCVVTVSIEDWLGWFRNRLHWELGGRKMRDDRM